MPFPAAAMESWFLLCYLDHIHAATSIHMHSDAHACALRFPQLHLPHPFLAVQRRTEGGFPSWAGAEGPCGSA